VVPEASSVTVAETEADPVRGISESVELAVGTGDDEAPLGVLEKLGLPLGGACDVLWVLEASLALELLDEDSVETGPVVMEAEPLAVEEADAVALGRMVEVTDSVKVALAVTAGRSDVEAVTVAFKKNDEDAVAVAVSLLTSV
jgi:hypothetical protein